MGILQKRIRVGLFGNYGNNNLGDEAIIKASIENLRERIPNIEIIGLSLKPLDTKQRHNINSFPLRFDSSKKKVSKQSDEIESLTQKKEGESSGSFRSFKELLKDKMNHSSTIFGIFYYINNLRTEIRFLRRVRERLENLDVLIICGSNQLGDWFGGVWGRPYTLFKWVQLAKLTDTQVFFVSVGAGPVLHSLSYFMFKKSLKHADYLSYRDQGSKSLIESNISKIRGDIYPDLAHSLKLNPGKRNHKKSKKLLR